MLYHFRRELVGFAGVEGGLGLRTGLLGGSSVRVLGDWGGLLDLLDGGGFGSVRNGSSRRASRAEGWCLGGGRQGDASADLVDGGGGSLGGGRVERALGSGSGGSGEGSRGGLRSAGRCARHHAERSAARTLGVRVGRSCGACCAIPSAVSVAIETNARCLSEIF